jgi:HK97 family phage major capsid protein
MALSTTNSAELTQEVVQRILVQPLESASVFLASGPRIFDTDGSPVRIPKLNSAGTANFVAQGSAIGEADYDFGEIELLASSMKSVKVLTKVSNELRRQSVIALDSALRDRLVSDVAATLDKAFINGTATGEPTGILHYSGVTVAGSAIGTATPDHLYTAMQAALDANVNVANTRWMMTPRDFVALHKLKDAEGRYLISPNPTNGATSTLLGLPVTVTSRIPGGTTGGTATVVLADFSQIAVARDQSPSVTILDQTFGDYDQTAIRVTARYDAAPMNAAAVVLLKGVTTWGTA